MANTLEYPVVITPITTKDGRGFLATVPDLPGCVSDGDTPEEALAKVRDAIASWIEVAQGQGRAVPRPSAGQTPSFADLLLAFPGDSEDIPTRSRKSARFYRQW